MVATVVQGTTAEAVVAGATAAGADRTADVEPRAGATLEALPLAPDVRAVVVVPMPDIGAAAAAAATAAVIRREPDLQVPTHGSRSRVPQHEENNKLLT
eukprot:m.325010 g.325010  ORF g.325010 m.325010 type:complete len:99 (-) comp27639_c3_seq1:558-854(-)